VEERETEIEEQRIPDEETTSEAFSLVAAQYLSSFWGLDLSMCED
jgi:hypothetical protein